MVSYIQWVFYEFFMLFDHKSAWSDDQIYKEIYENSIKTPNEFWKYHAQDIFWKESPISAFDENSKNWLDGGISNICYNCVDRHAKKTPNKPAIIWHGDEKNQRREVSYSDLQKMVIKISSILINSGIKKGDVVGIYMPMVPESIAAMLACARLGAVHMVVFAGFSPEALAYRLETANAKVVLTVTSSNRGGKRIEILKNVEIAISKMKTQSKIINLDNLESHDIETNDKIEWQNNKDDLFILYTSGSSGKPKGIIHSALPYILYVSTTFKFIFDINPNDVYFCTSDIGWITGHSYITYAPLFHGLTTVIFEGSPTYPEADRYWDIIEKEKVSIFYSAPTAIRSLQMFNDNFVKKHDLSSLRILGSVGEPINQSAWKWYFEVVGNSRCPIMDTWWQTESGGIVLAPLRKLNQKPGIAGKPFFGVSAQIVNSDDEKIEKSNTQGELTISNNWPGLCRFVVYECELSGNTKKFCENKFRSSYFKNDVFLTGDGAIYDKDFDIKISGRLDDVINISGHRLGTAEFECAINKIDEVKESAVVAIDHEIKGQTAFAYVVLKNGFEQNSEIVQKIIKSTRKTIGAIAKPDFIAFVSDFPKTRSGKIVRHLLRDIANRHSCDFKDISSVVNQESIDIVKSATENALNCPDMCKLR